MTAHGTPFLRGRRFDSSKEIAAFFGHVASTVKLEDPARFVAGHRVSGDRCTPSESQQGGLRVVRVSSYPVTCGRVNWARWRQLSGL